MEAKFQEILKLLDLQKQALKALAVELVTPAPQITRSKVHLSTQKAIIFRAKIEQKVGELSILQ